VPPNAAFMQGRKKIVFAVLLIIHILWVFHILAPQNILNSEPIYNVDYPFHYYNSFAAREMFHVSGQMWGYDPFFWAGYPCNVFSDLDNKWVETLLVFSPKVAFAILFKLIVFASLVAMPVFMYLAAGNFGLLEGESLTVFALSVFISNAGRYTYLKLTNGMFSYVLMCFACIYFLSLLYKFFRQPGLRNYIAFAVTAALIPLVHLFAVIIVGLPSLIAYAASFRKKAMFHIGIFLAALLTVLVNYFWIYPFLRFCRYKILLVEIARPPGIERFFGDLFMGVEANIGIILLVFGIYGMLLYARKKDMMKASIFSSLFLWMLFLAYFGAYNRTIMELEPYRFRFVMQLALVIPAASAMCALLPSFYSRIRQNAFATAMLAVFLIALFYPIADKQINRAFLHTSLPGDYYALSDYISKNITGDSRIIILPYRMIITDDKRQDESFWFWLLPALTGREVIPELTDFYPMQYISYPRKLFRGEMTNRSPEELSRYLRNLNVGYIISWGQDPGIYLKYGFLSKKDTVGRFTVYKVRQPHSYFFKGSGRVKATYNKISVKNASKGTVILKYHWMEMLKTDPPLKMKECFIKDDPVGYIEIENGSVSDFVIYNSYR